MNTADKVKQGKKNRKNGKDFENKVRADLEKQGWRVDKWTNNLKMAENSENILEWEGGYELKAVKPKFNPFTHTMMMNSGGFPDFIAFKKRQGILSFVNGATMESDFGFNVIGVEAKINGKLDKIEQSKCKWYLQHEIFNRILIAKKGEKRGEIIYSEFNAL